MAMLAVMTVSPALSLWMLLRIIRELRPSIK